MTKQIDIAIVGAASLAGEAVLSLLSERKFPLATLYAVDVVEQTESHVEYKDDPIPVHELADFDFEKVQLAIFLLEAPLAAQYAPRAAESGCIVIDTSICFRHEDNIPLVVPGVNEDQVARYRERMILTVPASASSQLIRVLNPIYKEAGLDEVVLTVMQSVSESGRAAQEELGRQTAQLLSFQQVEKQVFPVQVAFNVIPQTGVLLDEGYSSDELDLIKATQKALNNGKISVRASIVTVAAFFGMTLTVSIRTLEPISTDRIAEILDNADGIRVNKPESEAPVTMVTHANGNDEIIVDRIRSDLSGGGYETSFVCMADNVRTGAALNSVQIAEILVKGYL